MEMSRNWLAAVVLVVASAAPAFAQGEQARFAGTVRDQSGADFAGATVTARNERTGEVRTVVSNEKGYYLVPGLKPATYTLHAEKTGFAAIEYTGITLGAGQEMTLDLELQAEGVQQSVTVVAATPTLDLSSARMGANVSEREVQDLPVNGRQMSQLMLQAPGSQNAGTGTWKDVRFSGRAVEQNVIKLRRHRRLRHHRLRAGQRERREQHAVQAAGEPRERPGVPRRVEQLPGGIRHRHRRPGQRHHQVGQQRLPWRAVRVLPRRQVRRAELLRLARATPTAASLPTSAKSQLKQNQFGGSFGGPIAKNRAFFFGSYEGYRLDAGLNFSRRSRAMPRGRVPYRPSPRCGRIPGTGRGDPAGRVDQPRLRHRADTRRRRTSTENAFSARLDFKLSADWSSYVRVFRERHEQRAPGRHRPPVPDDIEADQRRLQPAGRPRHEHDERPQVRVQRGRIDRVGSPVADLPGYRPEPERNGRQLRYRRPGRDLRYREPRRPGARQQRRQRPVGSLRPLLADVRRHAEPASRATTTSSWAGTSG